MRHLLSIVPPVAQTAGQFGELRCRFGGQRGARLARSQALGIGEHRLEQSKAGWVGQLIEPHLVPLADRVGPVGPDRDPFNVRRDEKGRVLECAGVLEQLTVRRVQVLVLALVLPGKATSAPNVRPAFTTTGLTGALLERVGGAGRIGVGRWLVEKRAQVQKVLLGSSAFVASVGSPFGDECGGGHQGTLRNPPHSRKPRALKRLPRIGVAQQFTLSSARKQRAEFKKTSLTLFF